MLYLVFLYCGLVLLPLREGVVHDEAEPDQHSEQEEGVHDVDKVPSDVQTEQELEDRACRKLSEMGYTSRTCIGLMDEWTGEFEATDV